MSHLPGTLVWMPPAPRALQFSAAARLLAAVARRQGWDVPAFRSPPQVAGADRTLRRHRDGTAVVAVRTRGRPAGDIVRDLVEGVVVANGLRGAEAARCRELLLQATTGETGR